jgi:Flp pilus assembly protein TadD
VLNNQGYSYMLRGDYVRARTKLAEARALDPKSPYIQNNLKLLAESSRKGKAIQ